MNITDYLDMTFYRHAKGETVAKDNTDTFFVVKPNRELVPVASIEEMEDVFDRLRKK